MNTLTLWVLIALVVLGITVPVIRSFIRARRNMDRAFRHDLRNPRRDTGGES